MQSLVVEIGNTALKAAIVEDLTIGKSFRYQGEKKIDYVLSLIKRERPGLLVLSSVSDISSSDENKLKSLISKLLILDPSHKDYLVEKGFPEYLSCDRSASLLAARHLFKGKACTVVDFGTTLTIDFLDNDGNYLGGNISLGLRTRFKAINRYSKNLPLVNMPVNNNEIGNSLKESIESGVTTGIMFEIEKYLNKKPQNINVFTGGDAFYFVKRTKNTIFVVCNLVLMGLALIANDYV